MSNFFDDIPGEFEDPTIPRSVSLKKSQWEAIEAYRIWGQDKTKKEVSLKSLIEHILMAHIDSETRSKKVDFNKNDESLKKRAAETFKEKKNDKKS